MSVITNPAVILGEMLTVTEPMSVSRADGHYRNTTIPIDATVEIRRINTNRSLLRWESRAWWVSNEDLNAQDPNAPKPRRLGEVPEGGLDPNDPRLTWLWEDAARVAKEQGYCPTYDYLTAKLGIPGRPRDFTVKRTINGLEVSGKFMATSMKNANEQFDAAIALTGGLADALVGATPEETEVG